MQRTGAASTSRTVLGGRLPRCRPTRIWAGSSQQVQSRSYADVPTVAGGKLAQIIRDSIRATGPIPLSRYMQFCLSHPTQGYYSKGDVFGSRGDFITSPEISQIFGELVGVYFLTRYLAHGGKGPVRLVELGPGRGTLMDDILRTLSNFPQIADKIKQIHLVENSLKMQELQGAKLAPRIEGKGIEFTWSDMVDGIEDSDAFTMIVAHEFFDAMPINLFEKREDGYREVQVDLDPQYTPGLSTSKSSGLRLAISREPNSLSTVLPATSPRFAKLPIGSRIEIAQESYKITRRLGEIISAGAGGAGLVVDYGGDRVYGSSFRAFRNHKIVDVFDEPGSSDLTANVDFAYLRESLEGVARPLTPIPQSQFLNSLGLQPRLMSLLAAAPSDARREDMRKAAKRLIDPLGMGEEYKVMGFEPLNSEGEVYPFPSVQPETESPGEVGKPSA